MKSALFFGGEGKMFKRIFLGLIIVGVCGVSVLAQDKDKEDPLSLVYEQAYPEFEKTKLVLEYKSDEPIVDVIFDEATMTVKEARALGIKGLEKRKATEIVKVRYPKVVAPKDAVHPRQRIIKGVVTFLNEKGSITNQISLRDVKFTENGKEKWIDDECWLSSNGEYAGVVTTSGIPGGITPQGEFYESTIEKVKFSLIDKNGNILWEKTVMDYLISKCIISNDGKRILMVSNPVMHKYKYSTGIYLYNEKGKQIWKQEYGKGIGDTIGDTIISKNGKYIAGRVELPTGIRKPPYDPFYEYWLIFYDIDKENFWQYKLEEKSASWVILSENGDVDVKNNDIRKNETIYSFTKDGKLKDARR